MRLTAWACALVVSVASSTAAELSVEVEDVGVRRHVGHRGWTTFVLRASNDSAHPFRGEIAARASRPLGLFRGDAVEQRFSRTLDVPARTSTRVCLRLPLSSVADRVVFEALDATGRVAATRTWEVRDSGVVREGGQLLVGVWTASVEDAQSIHEAVLFPPGATPPTLTPPRLKLLSLPPDSLPPCAECYDELTFLVVASALPPRQQELIGRAMLAGLHVLVVERAFAGHPPFANFPTAPAGLVSVGLGSLQRVPSVDDADAFARVRAAASSEEVAARSVLAGPPEEVFDHHRWMAGHFREAELPPAGWLVAGLGLYALLMGPVSFVVLRARDRRERAWLVLPLGALASATLLFAWVRAHAFPALELDAARCVFSRDSLREGRTLALVRIASPSGGLHLLRAEGAWSPMQGDVAADKPPDFHWDDGAIEVRGIEAPQWSTTDLVFEGAGHGAAPVSWAGDAIRNHLPLPFSEAVLLAGEDVFETRHLSASGTWRLSGVQPSRKLLQLVRSGLEPRLESPSLADALVFQDQDHVRRTMTSIRGLFVGVVEGASLPVTLRPSAESERRWTLYVHVFEKEGSR